MNYPNYQPQGQPQYAPQPGYAPQQGQPQYAPQPGYAPQQGYGPQGQPQQAQPPAPPREQWGGGAAFDATPMQEKRDSLTFKGAQPGARRTVICDMDPVVIHGTDYATKQPAYDSKGNPKWTVGTGVIDEYGQDLTHWCGKWSRAAIQYTTARQAVGLGPQDSMRGWVVFIQYNGDVPTNSGTDAKDYTIQLAPLEQAMQYLTQAQVQAAQAKGITRAEAPGNMKCAPETPAPAPQAQPVAQGQPYDNGGYMPPAVQPVPAGFQQAPPAQSPLEYGYQQAHQAMPQPVHTPQPQYPAPQGQPYPGPQGPQGYAPAPQQAYAPQQGQPGMMAPPAPQQAPQQAYGAAPQGQPDPMAQAVHTVQNVLGGQPIQQAPMQHQAAPQPPSEVSGYRVDALATYATMPDNVLASMWQDVNGVRMAIEQAKNMGALPPF